MGIDFSGQRDRQRHSRSSVAPLAYDQYQRRQLPAEGEAQGRGVDAGGRRTGHGRGGRMIPAMPTQVPTPRLRLKRAFGWFAAGLEVATALPLLSDAAFKLYMFLCLNVDRYSARMVWEPAELAHLLHRDGESVSDSLRELCRRGISIRHPPAAGRYAKDRLSVEICKSLLAV